MLRAEAAELRRQLAIAHKTGETHEVHRRRLLQAATRRGTTKLLHAPQYLKVAAHLACLGAPLHGTALGVQECSAWSPDGAQQLHECLH